MQYLFSIISLTSYFSINFVFLSRDSIKLYIIIFLILSILTHFVFVNNIYFLHLFIIISIFLILNFFNKHIFFLEYLITFFLVILENIEI